MIRLLCLTMIGLCSLHILLAQETVRIYLAPEPAQISIDGQAFERGVSLETELSAGTHIITLTNPKYQTIKDTIEVQQGQANIFRFSFKRLSIAFEAYREESSAYTRAQTSRWLGNIFLPIVNVTGFIYAIDLEGSSVLRDIEEEAAILRTEYQDAINPNQALSVELNYLEFQDQYQKRRREMLFRRGIGIPLFLGTSYFSYRVLKKLNTRNKEKPVWQPEASISLQQLDIQPSPNGLVMNLKITF